MSNTSEQYRHDCEARLVAALPDNDSRKRYLDAVAAKRGRHGKEVADRLRSSAWQIMRGRIDNG